MASSGSYNENSALDLQFEWSILCLKESQHWNDSGRFYNWEFPSIYWSVLWPDVSLIFIFGTRFLKAPPKSIAIPSLIKKKKNVKNSRTFYMTSYLSTFLITLVYLIKLGVWSAVATGIRDFSG
jgi:hypothetical protein